MAAGIHSTLGMGKDQRVTDICFLAMQLWVDLDPYIPDDLRWMLLEM